MSGCLLKEARDTSAELFYLMKLYKSVNIANVLPIAMPAGMSDAKGICILPPESNLFSDCVLFHFILSSKELAVRCDMSGLLFLRGVQVTR